jgi:uncharacterized protein YprB with RNaseH-like and TPR domain
LRQTVARINRKYAAPRTPQPAPGERIDEVLSGAVVSTAYGEHFETERLWERHRRHGCVGISDLADLPGDLLDSLSDGDIQGCSPQRWAFLDTETTGLGAGAHAFLIGVGHATADGFRLRQFFMRDFREESSLLDALANYLEQFEVLITYNGKSYDQPLLESRFAIARRRHPFARLRHLDLLFGARRLWKLRLDSCRLVQLEKQILGVEREGDLPGELIPYYYFDFVRTQQALRLVPIFHHNAIDILSLACLTAVVPQAFRAPEEMRFGHGADMIGLAHWLLRAKRHDEALRLFHRAVELGLPDHLLFPTLWETAKVEKRIGRTAAALAGFTDLAESRNPYRVHALEEVAKYYEHRERNYVLALEITRKARDLGDTAQLRRREERLARRAERADGIVARTLMPAWCREHSGKPQNRSLR